MENVIRIAGLAALILAGYLEFRTGRKRVRVYQRTILDLIFWLLVIVGLIGLTGIWELVVTIAAFAIPLSIITAFMHYSWECDRVDEIPKIQTYLSNARHEGRVFEANIFEDYLARLEAKYVEAFDKIHNQH
jgi:hypothetical protein